MITVLLEPHFLLSHIFMENCTLRTVVQMCWINYSPDWKCCLNCTYNTRTREMCFFNSKGHVCLVMTIPKMSPVCHLLLIINC